jgi:murein DD-endopeptidase MepM/ murein hydrolase activator NlpD
MLGSPSANAASTGYSLSFWGTSASSLSSANNLNGNRGGFDMVTVDGALVVPGDGPSGTVVDIQEKKPSADQISIYVVREGDTLSQIGKLFDVSPNTILWANDLKSSKDIHPGDTLVILPVTGVQYVVKKGDSAASLAKKYKSDADEILAFNHIDSLTVGETIIIPDGVEGPAVTTSTGSNPARPSAGGPTIAGYFMRPIIGGVKTQGIHGYNGVDLGTPVGTRVMASASGVVMIARSAGYNGGYGEYVVIQHPNGTQTVYAHLSTVFASSGQSVTQGQVIGLSGNSGKSTGPHLHFEIRGAANPF